MSALNTALVFRTLVVATETNHAKVLLPEPEALNRDGKMARIREGVDTLWVALSKA